VLRGARATVRTGRTAPPRAVTDVPTAADPRSADGLAAAVDAGLDRTVRVLRQYLDEQRTGGESLHPAFGSLWSALTEQVGGKLLRPRLTLAAYLGLGGDAVDGAAHVAAAQELVHTAMVVHDDLIDHDEVRRGRPNLAGTYRARLAGDGVVGPVAEEQVLAAGLLGGDLALVAAFGVVARAPLPAEARVRVVDLLVRGVTTTVGGELLDVAAGLRAAADVDAVLIAELKTAAYTCAVPLRAGALLAGADDRTVAALDRFGTALGTAFQLVDDDLGVFGDPDRTGKSVLSDLRAGKRTELLRLTYLRTDSAGRGVLDAAVGRHDLDDAGAADVREVMTACGARGELARVAGRAAEAARQEALEGLPADLATYLCALVDDLAGRQH
jgi:geranylgeranyl diphosphate synthase type I